MLGTGTGRVNFPSALSVLSIFVALSWFWHSVFSDLLVATASFPHYQIPALVAQGETHRQGRILDISRISGREKIFFWTRFFSLKFVLDTQ